MSSRSHIIVENKPHFRGRDMKEKRVNLQCKKFADPTIRDIIVWIFEAILLLFVGFGACFGIPLILELLLRWVG